MPVRAKLWPSLQRAPEPAAPMDPPFIEGPNVYLFPNAIYYPASREHFSHTTPHALDLVTFSSPTTTSEAYLVSNDSTATLAGLCSPGVPEELRLQKLLGHAGLIDGHCGRLRRLIRPPSISQLKDLH